MTLREHGLTASGLIFAAGVAFASAVAPNSHPTRVNFIFWCGVVIAAVSAVVFAGLLLTSRRGTSLPDSNRPSVEPPAPEKPVVRVQKGRIVEIEDNDFQGAHIFEGGDVDHTSIKRNRLRK